MSRRWAFDLNPPEGKVKESICKPVGDVNPVYTSSKRTTTDPTRVKVKKAWEIATSPFRSLLMYGFLMWMTPNSANIISISICVMTLFTSLKAVFSVNSAFASYSEEKLWAQLLVPKLVYVLLNLVAVGMGLWKINKFGLLPLTEADWIASYQVKQPMEFAMGDSQT